MGDQGFQSGEQDDSQFGNVGGDQQSRDQPPHVEVHTGKPHRVQVKVRIPAKEHPNFNFVGKLLGPKGSSLKQLQEMTQTRMAILGRGSMRDKKKEEELRTKGEVKYAHLNEDLHVEVSAYAPPAEAYRRIAHAIDELSHFLIPEQYGGDMSMNGARGPKPPVPPQAYGYEDPSGPRPPGPVPPPSRGGYWASAPSARGGAAAPPGRRALQPRPPAPGGARRPPAPPAGGPDYSYDDPYGRYDAGGTSTDYYADQGMEETENFAADDYSAEPRGSAGGPARSSFGGRARPHPYSSSARPY